MMDLTIYEAAKVLNLSPASVHQLAAGGIIPSRGRADCRVIARKDLCRWAASWGAKLQRAAEVIA
jgi:hypothetical protein